MRRTGIAHRSNNPAFQPGIFSPLPGGEICRFFALQQMARIASFDGSVKISALHQLLGNERLNFQPGFCFAQYGKLFYIPKNRAENELAGAHRRA